MVTYDRTGRGRVHGTRMKCGEYRLLSVGLVTAITIGIQNGNSKLKKL